MATSKPMSPLNSLAHATLSTGGVASNAEPNATTSPMPATINAAALASTAAPSNSSSDSTRQRQLTPPPTPKPLQLQHHASEALGLAASTPKAPAQPSLAVLLRPPGFQTGASPNAPVPGLLAWEEATDTYRASAASQSSRVWLRWPGTPDPDSGWLLAELLVLQAGGSPGASPVRHLCACTVTCSWPVARVSCRILVLCSGFDVAHVSMDRAHEGGSWFTVLRCR